MLSKPEVKAWELGELLRDLERRIADELRQQVYFLIAAESVPLVAQPTSGWESAVERFESSKEDIIEASWCLACDRWTATVFHLMRVLEHGLRAFAGEIDPSNPVDQENWKNIIDQIESKIREMEKLPRSADKSAKLQRYSELASQFRYFKDAWRNHVSHARTAYDYYQSSSVYAHVRDFMKTMAADFSDAGGRMGGETP
jgi:hypothetical protein